MDKNRGNGKNNLRLFPLESVFFGEEEWAVGLSFYFLDC